jgi:hypothetical protein
LIHPLTQIVLTLLTLMVLTCARDGTGEWINRQAPWTQVGFETDPAGNA